MKQLVLVLCTLITASALHAQVTGNISGYVRDPSGAAIPNATVTATMIEQQTVRTAQTDADGSYSFQALPPGHYDLAFESQGFQRQISSGQQLTVSQNLRVDATLSVGSVQTAVEVGSSAPLVDTVSAGLSGLIDDRRVVDLPLNGRNVISLARILPGVLNVNAPQQMSDARGGPEMDVNGGRANMNLFSFDGGYFNNPSRNTGLNFPPPDAVQEVRILTHNFSAEYGHNPGSQVEVLSKAGTNAFHGALWEFLRNEDLNARNFFSPRVPAEKQNQFGAAAGGPIVKDKLFVFGSYQGLRDHREAQSIQALVPSDAERSGDFTAVGQPLTNPTDVLTGLPFTDPNGGPCVVNNRIAPGCISPVAQNLLKYVPSSPTGTVVSLAASPRHDDLGLLRVDWNVSEKNRLSGHYYEDQSGRSSPFANSGNISGYIGENFDLKTRQVTVNDIYTFGLPSSTRQFFRFWIAVRTSSKLQPWTRHLSVSTCLSMFPPALSALMSEAISTWVPASRQNLAVGTISLRTA